MNRYAMLCVVAAGLAGMLAPAFSQDQGEKKGARPGEMSPEVRAWMEAATPGPNHRLLNYCIGEWQVTVRHWMQPGQESPPSTGICVNEWVLGGRFVKTTYKGSFMHMPFEGIGYTGYDKVTHKFVSTWMDNMGTGIMRQIGTYDPQKKLFTYTSEMRQPTGEMVKQVETIQIIDENHHVMTFFHQTPAMDHPVKAMELSYSRIKKAMRPGGSKPPK